MLSVREATHGDCKDVFDWRSDQLSRMMSRSSGPLSWEAHKSWFDESISRHDRILLICYEETWNKKIAVVRFDVIGDAAIISINLAPQSRGKRKSKQCLDTSIAYFLKEFSGVRLIDAEIKPINIASQVIFEKLAFVCVGSNREVMRFRLDLGAGSNEKSSKRILFLGYGQPQRKLIDSLASEGCEIDTSSDRITKGTEGYDYVISYGYTYILSQEVIDEFKCPVFNLHISYLPYNRGAYPNFWSFYDNTPSGVTIHLMDGGIDTGPIVKQRRVEFFGSDLTFARTYDILMQNMEDLFAEFLPSLLANSWRVTPQPAGGTHHNKRELPTIFAGWDSIIVDEIARLRKEGI